MIKSRLLLALSLAMTTAVTGCSDGDADENVVRSVFAVGETVKGLEDSDPVEGDVSENDMGEGLSYALASGASAVNGELTFNADGTFVYTPNPDFFGQEHIEYTVTLSSSGQTDTATLIIDIANDYENIEEYGWQLASEDDFEQINDAKWVVVNGTTADGSLNLTAPVSGSAMLVGLESIRIDGNSVGRIEIAVKTPDSNAFQTVVGVKPITDAYQGQNRLSLLEGNSDALIAGVHYGTGLTSGVSFNEDSLADASAEFHAYAIEWDKDQIRWYIDGFHVHTATTLNTWGYTLDGDSAVIDNDAPFNQDLQLFVELSNLSGDEESSVVVDYVKTWTCDTSVDSTVTNCGSGVKSTITKAASDRIETLDAVVNDIFSDGFFDNNDVKVSDLNPIEWHYSDEVVEAAISNWNSPTIEILEEESEHGLVIDVTHPEGDANVGITMPGVQIIGLDTTLSFDMYIDSANTNTETLDIRMETGWPFMGMFTWNVADLVLDEWQTYTIKVNEFVDSPFLAPDWLTWLPGIGAGDALPLDPNYLNSLLVIEFHGGVHFRLDNISLSCISNENCIQAPMSVQEAAVYEPSTIYEAENYDAVGGEVAIEDTSDKAGGQNVGWIDAGEYLEYTISAPIDGVYQMDYRLASGSGSEGFNMSINDTLVDTQSVDNTGGWQSWVTQSSPEFELTTGLHTVRFDFTGGGINFNYFELNSPLFEIFLEAEEYVNADGVQTEDTTDENGGQNVGWIDAGDYLEYTVNIPVEGSYKITYRVASQGGSDGFETSLDGEIIETHAVDDTGGWQNWKSDTVIVDLPAGEQTLRLDFIGGSVNLNWIRITN